MRGVQLFLISKNHWNSLLESMNQVKVLEFKISTVILVHLVIFLYTVNHRMYKPLLVKRINPGILASSQDLIPYILESGQ